MAITARVEFIKIFRTVPVIKDVLSCEEISTANTTVESSGAPVDTEAVRIIALNGSGYVRVGESGETVDSTNGLYLNFETDASTYMYLEKDDVVLVSSE